MNKILSHAIVTLFLCGDIMSGRGIDQILPYSAPPQLFEPYVRDARRYVELAEQFNGAIPRKADFTYVWGDALAELRRRKPDARIVNLETSITAGGEPWLGKGIHYRMHPGNVSLLSTAGIDVCSLANNHVIDWGYGGLAETLETLRKARIRTAGAGRTRTEAETPAVVEVRGKGRVIVFSFGAESSGIPEKWAPLSDRPGVNLLPDLSEAAASRIGAKVRAMKRPGDVVVASIHWGGNWGYDISSRQQRFAHLLLDRGGVDLIHGHSSHHAKGIEVYQGKLILYGCGDLITDYEGIGGYEEFRGDLGLMYFVRVDTETGKLAGLEMVPMQMRKFRLNRASRRDAAWLRDTLNREGKRLGTRVELQDDGILVLRWAKELIVSADPA
ncbi:putative polyglutamine synthesis accessory protein [Geobacteraceae bacterium]|nr:putative polyglutamine synthesis accessory protein [Geobacteraceae bacterium]